MLIAWTIPWLRARMLGPFRWFLGLPPAGRMSVGIVAVVVLGVLSWWVVRREAR